MPEICCCTRRGAQHFKHMVQGVAQNVPKLENLNHYTAISENLGRAKKIAGTVRNRSFVLSDTE